MVAERKRWCVARPTEYQAIRNLTQPFLIEDEDREPVTDREMVMAGWRGRRRVIRDLERQRVELRKLGQLTGKDLQEFQILTHKLKFAQQDQHSDRSFLRSPDGRRPR